MQNETNAAIVIKCAESFNQESLTTLIKDLEAVDGKIDPNVPNAERGGALIVHVIIRNMEAAKEKFGVQLVTERPDKSRRYPKRKPN